MHTWITWLILTLCSIGCQATFVQTENIPGMKKYTCDKDNLEHSPL